MIVRPVGDTAELAMQVDHAEVAGQLAAAWGGPNVPALEPRNSVLTATEKGYGKRTPIDEYTRHGRGTKGMIAIQQSERNGKVVAATLVRAEDEIILITDRGVLVRTRVSEIRELGRATQGVTLIALDEGAKLNGLQRIVENDAQGQDADAADEDGAATGANEPTP